jgi:1-acyl-sn-glycerol-3-phosphate acyltransferase
MAIGAYGFLTGSVLLLLVTLFFMGLHSAFFGPVKYSILPQLLRKDELVSGNAYVEMGTFLAILLGTILGGTLIAHSQLGPWLVGATVLIVAVLGWYSSMRLVPLAPVAPALRLQVNPIVPTWQSLKRITQTRSIFLSILGISWFWFFGAAILSILPAYCKDFLHGDEALITLFLALFSVGIGIGSILCGRLSARKLELGLVPLGSLGISLFSFELFLAGRPDALVASSAGHVTILELLASAGGWRIVIDLLLLAIFGGFFIVPLYTLIQQRSQETERSRIIAGNNILNALFMVVAALLLVLLFHLQLTIPQIFLILALLNLGVATSLTVLPGSCFAFVGIQVMYRLRFIGRDNLPLEGPAVLVCNHVSLVDWLIIASACPRPIRFVIHHSFLSIPLTRRIFKDAKVIPIAGTREDPAILESAFAQVAAELRAGELVCIFPEGIITRDGEMDRFRPGVERIIRETPAPVVPMALNGLWGSFFSRKDGKPLRRPFRRVWSRVSLTIGEPVPPGEVSAERLEQLVRKLLSYPSE